MAGRYRSVEAVKQSETLGSSLPATTIVQRDYHWHSPSHEAADCAYKAIWRYLKSEAQLSLAEPLCARNFFHAEPEHWSPMHSCKKPLEEVALVPLDQLLEAGARRQLGNSKLLADFPADIILIRLTPLDRSGYRGSPHSGALTLRHCAPRKQDLSGVICQPEGAHAIDFIPPERITFPPANDSVSLVHNGDTHIETK